jgi:hypothetical protein
MIQTVESTTTVNLSRVASHLQIAASLLGRSDWSRWGRISDRHLRVLEERLLEKHPEVAVEVLECVIACRDARRAYLAQERRAS